MLLKILRVDIEEGDFQSLVLAGLQKILARQPWRILPGSQSELFRPKQQTSILDFQYFCLNDQDSKRRGSTACLNTLKEAPLKMAI